jgi:hypothetical protein
MSAIYALGVSFYRTGSGNGVSLKPSTTSPSLVVVCPQHRALSYLDIIVIASNLRKGVPNFTVRNGRCTSNACHYVRSEVEAQLRCHRDAGCKRSAWRSLRAKILKPLSDAEAISHR